MLLRRLWTRSHPVRFHYRSLSSSLSRSSATRDDATSQSRRSFSSSAENSNEWLAAGEQWVQWDTNAETRATVSQWVADNDVETLEQRLGSRLSFGTAGLRGVMGAGYNHMNDLVVLQTAQGLCQYVVHAHLCESTYPCCGAWLIGFVCLSHSSIVPITCNLFKSLSCHRRYLHEVFGETALRQRGITIGYDHRAAGSLNSQGFAEITARVFLHKGIPVHMLNGLVRNFLYDSLFFVQRSTYPSAYHLCVVSVVFRVNVSMVALCQCRSQPHW